MVNKRPLALSAQKVALLKAMRDQQQKASTASAPNIPSALNTALQRRADPMTFPLSSEQLHLWFDAQLAFGDTLEPISATWRLAGNLDQARLQQCFQLVIRRHEILRCVFSNSEGEPRQHLLPALPSDLKLISLSHLPESEQQQQLAQHLNDDWTQPFDLANGPLLRTQLLCLASSNCILQVTLHPLIGDERSLTIILEELASFYNSAEPYSSAEYTILPFQYADYAARQAQWQTGTDHERQFAFWQEHLASIPPRLDLSALASETEGNSSSLQRPLFERYKHQLSTDISQALCAFCEEEHCPPAILFQATWLALLYRYTAQPELVIGQYITHRQSQELSEVVGPFATFLPVVHRLSARITVRALLAQVQTTLGLILDNQDVPLEQLTTLVAPENQAALLQVTFAATGNTLSNALFSDLTLASLVRSPLPTPPSALNLCVHEEDQQHALTLSYPYGRFSTSAIQTLLEHYLTLLTHFLSHPEQSIVHGELLKPIERQQLLAFSNHRPSDLTTLLPQHTIHGLFEEQVVRTPEAIALVYEETSLTYSELNRRANQLAHALSAHGIRAEMTVGIGIERSLELVIALLAVLKVGGTYVPLDTTNPPDRLAYYVRDAQVTLMLTQAHLLSLLPPFTGMTLCIDRDWQEISQASTSNLQQEIEPHQLSYIIYTSGSTGMPKGAMNEHARVCNRLLWMKEFYQLGAHERFLQKTPHSFDVSVGEFFCPLISGACLVMAQPEGHKEPTYLVKILEDEAITTIHFVPSMLPFFLAEPDLWRCRSLKRVMCSGETLPTDTQERFFQRFPGVALHNLYGPTETAIEVSFWDCQPGAPERSIPIGRPISHVQLYVLDDQLQLVPSGVPGELYIGGIQVGRGYYRQVERTAEKFLPDPFGNGTRLYKTGDLVRMLSDGVIEFLGRRDQQVKIAGHRIELSEIESVMTRHPLVQQAVALVRDDHSRQKQLVAYLILDPSTAEMQDDPESATRHLIAQLRRYLHTQLPDYMVPAAFVSLAAFPLTLSGKLDRQALPAPASQQLRLNLAEDFVAPRSQIEQVLTAIALELLDIPQLGVHDNLFELGATSLSALQLLVRLRQELHINLTLKDILLFPTIADLATLAEQQDHAHILARSPSRSAALPLVPVPRDQPLPLSFAQQRLWFLDQLYPNQVFYLIPLVLRLRGSLDVPALRQSLREIQRRHEILRTIIQNEHGSPLQKILPSLTVPLHLLNLSSLTPDEREQQARHWIDHEIQTPFDLAHGPLLRLRLLRLHQHEHLLLVTMHHIVSDGWSIGVMWKELVTLYNAFEADKPSPLAPLSVQYADFAVWQRQWLQGEVLSRQLAYWKEHLAGRPDFLELPLDHPRTTFQTFQGGIQQFYLTPELSAQLRHLSYTTNVTLFMLLFAAIHVLLVAVTGQTDLVVGTPVANRNTVEIEPLIGFFVNTIALRTRLSGNPTFYEILQRVSETTLGGYDHQDVPFEQVVEAVQSTRDPSRSPLFQVLFTLQHMPLSSMALANLQLEPVTSNYQVAKFDLTLGFSEDDKVLSGAIEYNAALFEPGTIATLQRRLMRLLEMLVDRPALHLNELISTLHMADDTQKRGLPAMEHAPKKTYELSTQKKALLNNLLKKKGLAAPNTPTANQPLPPPVRRTDLTTSPLSFAQQRLWFLDQLDPGSATYTIPLAFALHGQLDYTALTGSLRTILLRHEVLRSIITNEAGTPTQQFLTLPTPLLPVIELSQLPVNVQETHKRLLIDHEAQQPFDLAHGPLVRLHLLRLHQQEHILLVTIHHMVFDGWSANVMSYELAMLYNALVAGKPMPLPDLTLQYADYANWQQTWLVGERKRRQLAYWQEHLAGSPAPLNLPLDFPRPAIQTFHGALSDFQLSPATTSELHALCQQTGTTLFMLLLAAFEILLFRSTGQRDFVVGTPVTNRSYAELERLIGCFVNTLALRTNLAGNPTCSEVLQRVRTITLDGYSHQDIPFEQIVEALQLPRDMNQPQLFQVMFSLTHSTSAQSLQLSGLRVESLHSFTQTAKVDLTLFLEESAHGLRGSLEYNTDLFLPATIENLLTHYQHLLQAFPTSLQQPITHIPLLTSAEQQRLLQRGTAERVPLFTESIQSEFEAQVARTPGSTALTYHQESLTYSQLNQYSNHLARQLLRHGIGPGHCVVLHVPRSLELAIGLLAIIKTGAAYVPLEPTLPSARIAFLLADTHASALLTHSTLQSMLPPYAGPLLKIDEIMQISMSSDLPNPVPRGIPEDIAYLIYTSGSTGLPKGVMINRRNVLNIFAATDSYLQMQRPGVWLTAASIAFDISVIEILWTFTRGFHVIIQDDLSHSQHSETTFAAQLTRYGVTHLQGTPSLMQLLLVDPATCEALSTLDYVILGGEPFPTSLARQLKDLLPHARIINAYGPTETTIYATFWPLESVEQRIPIGRPLINTTTYILDAYGNLTPDGVAGELFIGGAGVATGYLQRPDLTAERFVPDPFSPQPGARLYRTGDQVRYRSDGELEYIGRFDQQVKLNGYRIELGEIEALLDQHPQVRASVVLLREDTPGVKRLVAYVVPEGEEASAFTLQEFLRTRLPSYMLPSHLIFLAAFPLTTTGKVNRHALPPPASSSREQPTGETLTPRTSIEIQLVSIWEDLLQVQPIGMTDNFFALGGHSLLAVRLLAQIQLTFSLKLPLSILFQAPTIEQMAEVLQQKIPARTPLVALQTAGDALPFFCIHPIGGEIFCYVQLARYLGTTRPIYALQMPDLTAGQVYIPLEQLATHYIEALQQILPNGPYLLGGWSLGGVIAFEMAQQLSRQQQNVALLALIDSDAPALHQAHPISELQIMTHFVQDLSALFGFSLVPLVSQWKQLDEQQQLLWLLEQAQQAQILPAGTGLAQIEHLFRTFKSNALAIQHYRAQPYAGPVTFFNASVRPDSANQSADRGWASLLSSKGIVHQLPGTHYTLLQTPQVQELAQQLSISFAMASQVSKL